MNGPELITLGCRLNIAESDAMRLLAADQDDLVIVNSCAVTAEAVRDARQAIRRAKRARPDARIVVTGCAAQIEPETFAAMPEVARVVGNGEKYDRASFDFLSPVRAEPVEVLPLSFDGQEEEALRQAQGGRDWKVGRAEIRVSDIMQARATAPQPVASFGDRSRGFVEVQNGCDHRCTFCVIPYGRGNSRSLPAGAVVERIKALVGEGFQEIVLTGVDITSYGPDLPGRPSLGLLIERILRHVPDLPRLRLSSLDSVGIDARMFELLTGEPRIMPHLHLSLQSGDDLVLKRMKRRHLRDDAIALVQRLKAARPAIAIGADLIAGFPTEDDAMAANSLALVDQCDIVFGHIFPYSPRAGTPAARMPQVPPAVVKARAKALREATARRKADWLQSLISTKQRVLVERDGVSGHAENFARVRLMLSSPEDIGRIVPTRLIHLDRDTLIGVPL